MNLIKNQQKITKKKIKKTQKKNKQQELYTHRQDGMSQHIKIGNQNIRTNISKEPRTLSNIKFERGRANVPIYWEKWQKL